jgi:hypothetical protein
MTIARCAWGKPAVGCKIGVVRTEPGYYRRCDGRSMWSHCGWAVVLFLMPGSGCFSSWSPRLAATPHNHTEFDGVTADLLNCCTSSLVELELDSAL